MATNGTTRQYKELRLCVGIGADGNPKSIVVGLMLETDWGRDKPKSYDVELDISHLQAVLYQQVMKANGGKASVVCDKVDFSKRYKREVPVNPPTEPGDAMETTEPPSDPDCGHDNG